MGLTFRYYQDEIFLEVQRIFRSGVTSACVQSPTGSGKTALVAAMLRRAAERGKLTWFVVHRRELIRQAAKAFHLEGIRFGICSSDFPADPTAKVQIASIQTLVRRMEHMKAPNLIAWDEAHHQAANTWKKVYEAFPDAYHLGLTATPERLDGRGLSGFFQELVRGPSVQELISAGYLADFKVFAPPGVDASGVRSRYGDFVRSDLEKAADRPSITGSAVAHYKKHCEGQRCIAFCCSIQHSLHVVEQFNAAGIPARHVDGETQTTERDRAMRDFEDGKVLVLGNVDLFGEGVDCPILGSVLLLRPTQSLILHLQQCGRALRPSPGKECAIILDAAGNTMRHGFPDEDRAWSLEGHAGRKPADASHSRVRVCPECFAANRLGSPKCAYCGSVFPIKVREVAQVEGDLVEVDQKDLRRQRRFDQWKCKSEAELVEHAKRCKYRRPDLWARIVWRSRMTKRAYA